MSHFNKIYRICCINTRIQSLKVWLKFVLPWLKYSIFSRGLFFIGIPCRTICNPILKINIMYNYKESLNLSQ